VSTGRNWRQNKKWEEGDIASARFGVENPAVMMNKKKRETYGSERGRLGLIKRSSYGKERKGKKKSGEGS